MFDFCAANHQFKIEVKSAEWLRLAAKAKTKETSKLCIHTHTHAQILAQAITGGKSKEDTLRSGEDPC